MRIISLPASLLPGLGLAAAVATGGFLLHRLPGLGLFSPMILAILLGILWRNLFGVPARAAAGFQFSLRRLLRLAIILLGLQLTAAQVASVGIGGMAVIALSLGGTFLFTVVLGRALGVERGLAALIAAGTSICGASAVVAANTAIRARDEDVAYAIACVTVFGSIAMVLYPLAAPLLGLGAEGFGLWAGASIHEIAQVVAASYQEGQAAGDFGTIAKLARVMLLAPVVIGLGFAARAGLEGQTAARAPMPWFVLGFIALVAVNSLVDVPPVVTAGAAMATLVLLTTALAAMGLETDIRRLRARGLRPLILGAAAFLFIAGFSLMLVETIG
ncbi:YeiH family protein [Zavarzinia sp.]|uniref:YeiH family protein n=1 Tax=Zavarzinia sp. TaxID=2027920 RepID=UPI003BB71300